jgi:antitoxin component of MazEF toxin-antitoxin module
MRLRLRKIGNSYGVLIPRKYLKYDQIQAKEVDIVITDGYDLDKKVITSPKKEPNVITNLENKVITSEVATENVITEKSVFDICPKHKVPKIKCGCNL